MTLFVMYAWLSGYIYYLSTSLKLRFMSLYHNLIYCPFDIFIIRDHGCDLDMINVYILLSNSYYIYFYFFVNLGDRRRKHNKILGAINNDEVEGSRPYHPEVLTTNFEKEEGAEEGGWRAS